MTTKRRGYLAQVYLAWSVLFFFVVVVVCLFWFFFCRSVVYNFYTLKICSCYTELYNISKDILGELATVTELFALLCVEKIQHCQGSYIQGQKQSEKSFLNNIPK